MNLEVAIIGQGSRPGPEFQPVAQKVSTPNFFQNVAVSSLFRKYFEI